MTKSRKSTADPVTYPEGGTFGQLLEWHLEWGTRPGCSTIAKEENTPWTESEFAEFVHAGSAEMDSAERNLRNWKSGKLPDNKKNKDRIDRIFHELFGDDRKLRHWKADLASALEQGRTEQGARIAKREIAQPHAIPRPTAHFIGRDDDVETLAAALTSADRHSAILVQGGPGIGKTELTKAIAHHSKVTDRFGERRWFVPLETAGSAGAMEDAIVRAVGGSPRQGFAAALQSLGNRETLLILDNLETPWEPPEQRLATEQSLADLAAVPGVAILTSFRGREAIGGPRWAGHYLEALSRSEAATLLASIAGQWVRADPELQKFIDALGGIPLAVELVARRAHGRANLAPLWREWTKLGADLAVHPDFKAERLTSLPHSIELSLRSTRVTGKALRLFRLLGVLPAGLAREDLEALIGKDAFEAEERLLHIGLAIERADRTDLLPPIREHARRYHKPESDDATFWIEHFLEATNRLGATIGTSSGEGAMQRLAPEFDNIEAAFRTTIEQGELSKALDALNGIRQLTYFGSKSTTLFREIAIACHEVGDDKGEANCLVAVADMALLRSDHDTAQRAYEQARPLYQKAGLPVGEANCIKGIAGIAIRRFDHDAALAAFEEASQLYQKAEYVLGEAQCAFGFGNIASHRADYESARLAYERAATLFRKAGSAIGEANCIGSLGDLALERLDLEAAQSAYDQALPLFRQIGNVLGEAIVIVGLGRIALARSDQNTAQSAFEEALALYQRIGVALGEANCIAGFGDIALARADVDAARLAFEQALAIYRRVEHPLGVANCLKHLADIALARADKSAARSAYEDAMALFRQIENVEGETYCTRKLEDL